ncbi:MAG: sporulation protein YunB [Bacilli bacterium]
MKLKRGFNCKDNLENKIIFTLILVLLCCFIIFRVLGKTISPILINYAEAETRRLSSIIINNSIKDYTKYKTEDIINTVFNSNNEVVTVDFNTTYVNSILSSLVSDIQNKLKCLDEAKFSEAGILVSETSFKTERNNVGVVYFIPLGVVFNNGILGNVGPKIPLKTNLMGNVIGSINVDMHEYGINNILVKLFINIELVNRVILPFSSKNVKLKNDVLLASKIIQGKIPSVYGGSYSTTSPLINSIS